MNPDFQTLCRVTLIAFSLMPTPMVAASPDATNTAVATNLALVATPTTSFVSGHETLTALHDGFEPENSNDHSHPRYGNWPSTGTQWVCYEWEKPISTTQTDVYWWADGQGIQTPKACRVLFWDGAAFVPVKGVKGLGLELQKFNTTTFDEVTTTKIRLEFDGTGGASTGILEWKVLDSGKSPKFAPRIDAGRDRSVVLDGRTWFHAVVKNGGGDVLWSRESGPGEVTFETAGSAQTAATFSKIGSYVIKFTARAGEGLVSSDTLAVEVIATPGASDMREVYTSPYKIDSPLWNSRVKALICGWIPHCVAKLSDPKVEEGGIQNFIEASHKIAGRPFQPHIGAPWTNAYVLNTYESICMALMVDPQGDPEIIKSQAALRKTLDEWTPLLLGAQEKDGYMQTRFTLANIHEQGEQPPRWEIKTDHEGYVGGYFIEACIGHYQLTGGKDTRMLDAAVRLADCWDRNIGPEPKKAWCDGHQGIEQALLRLARVIDGRDGSGAGKRFVTLAKYLLDQRGGGESYDQSHAPVTQQYEALGHAVRAVYTYNAMAGVAMETSDADYQSAVESLWSNIVHRKYYVTGGVGSGETSEGFGGDYSLPHNAYCESCSGCGELFFQHKMNLARQASLYANLFEETLYNAILGSIDLPGENFTYTNALDSSGKRYKWHVCPCCIGNIPRTLLMLPEWTYARGPQDLFVNLFIGGTMKVNQVAGTDVEMIQKTDYPWKGGVSITVNPATPKTFALRIRVPLRDVSKLYQSVPEADGISSLAVNGVALAPKVENGYAVINREWKTGDKVDLVLPLEVQRVKTIDKVPANRGTVALRYGPLVYNIEQKDGNNLEAVLKPDAPLTAEWNPELLGGVMVIKGIFADGSKLTAIPNYARLNRGGRSKIWIKDK
jgi:DUF1680 family protein